MKLRNTTLMVAALVAFALAGCAADMAKQLTSNEQVRTQVMGAIAGNKDLAFQAVDGIMASDSLRAQVIDHLLTNDQAAIQVLVRIGTNPDALAPALEKLFAGQWKKGGIPPLWDGKTGERIVAELERLLVA